jgi:hypothetical protein
VVRVVETILPGNLRSLENAMSVVKVLDTARVSARTKDDAIGIAQIGQLRKTQ